MQDEQIPMPLGLINAIFNFLMQEVPIAKYQQVLPLVTGIQAAGVAHDAAKAAQPPAPVDTDSVN